MADTPAIPQRRSPSQPKPAGDESREAAAADWGAPAKSGGVRGEVKLALMLVMTLVAAFSFVAYRKFNALQTPLAAGEASESEEFQPLLKPESATEEVDLSQARKQAEQPDAPPLQDEIYQGAPDFPESAPQLAMSEPQRPEAIERSQPRRLSIQPANLVEEMEEQPQAGSAAPPLQSEPQPPESPIGLFGAEQSTAAASESPAPAPPPAFAPLEFPAESAARPAASAPQSDDPFSPSSGTKAEAAPSPPPSTLASPTSNGPAPLDLFLPGPQAPADSPANEPPAAASASSLDDGLQFAPESSSQPQRMEIAEESIPFNDPVRLPAAEADPAPPAPPPSFAPRGDDDFQPPVIVERDSAEPLPWASQPEQAAAPSRIEVASEPLASEAPASDVPALSFGQEPPRMNRPDAEPSRPAAGVRDEGQFSAGFESRSVATAEPIPFAASEPAAPAPPAFEATPAFEQDDPFAASPVAPQGDLYTVQPGDNYWTISKSVYGTVRYFSALTEYNRDRIPDPQKMKPGMQVATPAPATLESQFPQLFRGMAPQPATTAGNGDRSGFFVQGGQPHYRVGNGDTLTSIAQDHLGRASRWTQIHALNRDVLPTPDSLKLGTVLRLPHDASQVALTPDAPLSR